MIFKNKLKKRPGNEFVAGLKSLLIRIQLPVHSRKVSTTNHAPEYSPP